MGEEKSSEPEGAEGARAERKPRGEQTLAADLAAVQGMLEEERKRSEDYLTRLKYLQADFENYRKRVEREAREMEEFSSTEMVRKLLPIIDELDLAVSSAERDRDTGGILDGVKMVNKKLGSLLEAEGLRKIDALGKEFDPGLHEAVDKVQGKGHKEDIVVEEIRKGFTLKNKVLRPSMVKVELGEKEPSQRIDGEEE